jgi:hypothetical protein
MTNNLNKEILINNLFKVRIIIFFLKFLYKIKDSNIYILLNRIIKIIITRSNIREWTPLNQKKLKHSIRQFFQRKILKKFPNNSLSWVPPTTSLTNTRINRIITTVINKKTRCLDVYTQDRKGKQYT